MSIYLGSGVKDIFIAKTYISFCPETTRLLLYRNLAQTCTETPTTPDGKHISTAKTLYKEHTS